MKNPSRLLTLRACAVLSHEAAAETLRVYFIGNSVTDTVRYDAATWSSIAVLSEKSVADRSRPVDFPDFTKGKWKTTPPLQLMGV